MKFPSHIALPRETREALIELLNTCLATSIDLHSQVKQAHWNIRGKHFLSWHELFDEVATHVREQTDQLAERAGALGGYAQGTLRLAARHTELDEYDLSAITGDDHLRILVDRIARYGELLRDRIHRSDELNDPVTTDMLTRILGEVEHDLWLLESHLYGRSRMEREEAAPPEIPEELTPSTNA